MVSAPVLLGELAGPKAAVEPPGLRIYGTDMGMSYDHRGRSFIAFGDTWPYAKFICDNHAPHADDTIGELPKSYEGAVPVIDYVTFDESPLDLKTIQVHRDGVSLVMGYGKTPLTLFSDNRNVIGVFGRVDWTRCDPGGACPGDPAFRCEPGIGECVPGFWETPLICDPATREPCIAAQACMPSPSGFCVDTSSSQFDGSPRGNRAAVVQNLVLAAQRPDDLAGFDEVLLFRTNKFGNPMARTVRKFTGKYAGNDYRTGFDRLILWGRPGFIGEQGREVQLYMLTHKLPLAIDAAGKLEWEPEYYAGLDPSTQEPLWSKQQIDAAPLPLDGQPGGDPHEEIGVAQQMTISWLGAPINQWIMMYGGDEADSFLLDRENTRKSPLSRAIVVRFAEQAWGPWSPAQMHYPPGSPKGVGDPYGPGGVMYHNECVDTPEAQCARSDAPRPLESFLAGCPAPDPQLDVGKLYCPNIIEPYTQRTERGGFELIWNVSVWNPYAVPLLKTTVEPLP